VTFVDKTGFETCCPSAASSDDDTVVLYGGNNNWFAAYAYWSFSCTATMWWRSTAAVGNNWELDSRDLTKDVPERR